MAHFPIVTRDYVVKKASLLNIREMVNCYNSKLPDYKRKKEQELADQVQKMEDGDGVFVTVTCEKNKSRIEGFAQWIPCQYAQPEENERSLYYELSIQIPGSCDELAEHRMIVAELVEHGLRTLELQKYKIVVSKVHELLIPVYEVYKFAKAGEEIDDPSNSERTWQMVKESSIAKEDVPRLLLENMAQ